MFERQRLERCLTSALLQICWILLLPKTLQVLGHLTRERQVLGIEALNLLNAGAGVFGKVEDVDLAVRENDPHADRGVTQTIDAAFRASHRVVLEPSLIQQSVKVARNNPASCCSV